MVAHRGKLECSKNWSTRATLRTSLVASLMCWIVNGSNNYIPTVCDERCRNTAATIAKSLVGNYREEHLFALRQAVDLYETYQAKIADCDRLGVCPGTRKSGGKVLQNKTKAKSLGFQLVPCAT